MSGSALGMTPFFYIYYELCLGLSINGAAITHANVNDGRTMVGLYVKVDRGHGQKVPQRGQILVHR